MFRLTLTLAVLMAVSVKGDGVQYLGLNGPATPGNFMGIPMTPVPDVDPRGRILVTDATNAGQIQFSDDLLHITNGIGNTFPQYPGGTHLYHTSHFEAGGGPPTLDGPSSVTMTPPPGTTAFIFNLNLDSFDQEIITVEYEDGSSVSTEFNYFDGRQTFAAYRSNTAGNPVSVTVDCPGGTFAVGLFSLGTAELDPCDGEIRNGACIADPHFKTWTGVWYDFHGICDLVLLSAEAFGEGLGLDIHIRTKARYEYSYIEAAAIKLGQDVLEVGSWGEHFVNGVRDAEMPVTLGEKYTVHHEIVNKNKHVFKIQTGEKEAIVVHTHKDMVSVSVENATYANFATSTGMMGNFMDGTLVARDGITIMDDHDIFGQEWMVKEADGDLFLAPSPYKQCVPPSTIKQSRRLGEATVSEEAAEKACAHYDDEQKRDMCVFDVIAMADLEVAEIHGAF